MVLVLLEIPSLCADRASRWAEWGKGQRHL